jgi:hypothetical protein
MVSTLIPALLDAEIEAWIWGPREQEDHIRILNLIRRSMANFPDGDPTLSAIRWYADLAEEAICEGHSGCLPIWGGPTVFDRERDTTPAELEDMANRLRDRLRSILANQSPTKE